jgi:hypothetical protein
LLVMVASIEVQQKMQSPRNLFVSDPQFASERVREVSEDDLQRWQRLTQPNVRHASAPYSGNDF